MFGMSPVVPDTSFNNASAQPPLSSTPHSYEALIGPPLPSTTQALPSYTAQQLSASQFSSKPYFPKYDLRIEVVHKIPILLTNILPMAVKSIIQASLDRWSDSQRCQIPMIKCVTPNKSFTIYNSYAAHWWHYSQVNLQQNTLQSIIDILTTHMHHKPGLMDLMKLQYEYPEPPIELTLINFIFAFLPQNDNLISSAKQLLANVTNKYGTQSIVSTTQNTLENALRRAMSSTTDFEHFKTLVCSSNSILCQTPFLQEPWMQYLIKFVLSTELSNHPSSIQVTYQRKISLNQMPLLIKRLFLLVQAARMSCENPQIPTKDVQGWLVQAIEFLSPDADVLRKQYQVSGDGASSKNDTTTLEKLIQSMSTSVNEFPLYIKLNIPPLPTYEALQKGIIGCKQNSNLQNSIVQVPNINPNSSPHQIVYALSQWFEAIKSTTSWGGKGFWGPQGTCVEVNHPLLFLWMHFTWAKPNLGVQTELIKLANLYGQEEQVSIDLGITKASVPLGWALFYGLPEYILRTPASLKVARELLENHPLSPHRISSISNSNIPILISINDSLTNLPFVLKTLQEQLANVFVLDRQSNLSLVHSDFYLQAWSANLHHLSPLSQDPFARVLFNVLKKPFERGMCLDDRIFWFITNLYAEAGMQLNDGTLLNRFGSKQELANHFKSWVLNVVKTLSDHSTMRYISEGDPLLQLCENWLVFDGKSPVQNYIFQKHQP